MNPQNGELFSDLSFTLVSEPQAAPRAPAAAADVAAEMFPAADVLSHAPTALDRANATARHEH